MCFCAKIALCMCAQKHRFDLPVEGQEGFSVIKYDSSDEYLPHCDGNCDGEQYKPGGR
jgi:hypothetical protein